MSAIILTPLGKQVAENSQASGPKFAVLSLLYETNGPMDIEEVIDETRMEDDKAQMVLRSLVNAGYIKEV